MVGEIIEIESTLIMVEGIDELVIKVRHCITVQRFQHDFLSLLFRYLEVYDISSYQN